MDSDIKEKARALRDSLGEPPWLQAVGVGELGGEPAIFVYVSGQSLPMNIPDFWRGVPVWIRKGFKPCPAKGGGSG